MKKLMCFQVLIVAVLWGSFTVSSQNYNTTYGFISPYTSSTHTCGIQITNTNIIEGGTVDQPGSIPVQRIVELGIVNPATSLMTASPFQYSPMNGWDQTAVDLIESSGTPNDVVVVSDVTDLVNGISRIVVFKTNPATGVVAWSLMLGSSFPGSLFGAAIARDNNGDYYVFGTQANPGSTRRMYMAKLTDAGVVVWEQTYTTGAANDNFQAVDVLFDGAVVIVTANYYNPAPSGIIIARVNPGTGGIGPSRRVTVVGGNPDFQVRDMDFINGRYVLVGVVNQVPRRGFLLQYNPGFGLFAPFSQVYTINTDIYMTGVRPSGTTPPDIYVSYDRIQGGLITPGIARLNMNGFPLLAHFYTVPGYLGSRGLISVSGATRFAIKGGTNNTAFPGIPSLSLVGTNTPPVLMPAVKCDNQLNINSFQSAQETGILINSLAQNTLTCFDMVGGSITGTEFNCLGAIIGSFRKAPNGLKEKEKMMNMNIYPNPSNGGFTIELSDEFVNGYETAEIFNSLGEVVHTFNVNRAVETVQLNGQAPGVYLLRLKSSDGNVSDAQRFMIK